MQSTLSASQRAQASATAGARVTSIEARRILAVLQDCQSRIDYALILPTLNDFLEGRDNVPEDVEIAHNDFLNHQRALGAVMTADGEPKPGSQQDFEEERNLYKDCARDLIRAMRNHTDYFAPLLAQSMSSGGAAVKITTMMKELNNMEILTFATPVESDQKQKRLITDITQREKTNRKTIQTLKETEAATRAEKEQRIRDKEEQYDTLKQELTQAKASESALMQDDNMPEEVQTQEESLKAQLGSTKEELSKSQKKNSDDEGKKRRTLRKDEEALQALIQKYDSEMDSLVKQNEEASEQAEKIEKELHDLQAEAAAIEKVRAPIRNDEHAFIDTQLRANKLTQDMIAAAVKLQLEIRKYLKTAPKASKKKKGKKGKKK